MAGAGVEPHASVAITEIASGDVAAGDALDYVRSRASERFDVYRISGPASDLHYRFRAWQFGPLVLTLDSTGPLGVRRERHHVDRSLSDLVGLRVYRSGFAEMLDDGASVKLGGDAVHLMDYSRERDVRRTTSRQFNVRMPADMLRYDGGRHPAYMRFGIDSGAGLILNNAMASLEEHLPSLKGPEIPALAAGFVGLVQGLLSGAISSHDDMAVQGARAEAMCRYLDQHLRDPDVGLATLTQAFGASRATIYRDFAEYGGVERYVLQRRLRRAYDDLARQSPRRGAVAAVAESWGFTSIHYFSRAFRNEFGMPPSEVVGLTQSESPSSLFTEPVKRS